MSKMLIIVGAGSNVEIGLPTGHGLKDRIATVLGFHINNWGDYNDKWEGLIYNALRFKVKNPNGRPGNEFPYLAVARKIRNNMPLAPSIDSFINAHRGDEMIECCGKLAIVWSILESERHSKLYFKKTDDNSSIKYADIQDTWFTSFYQMLTDQCSKEDLAERFDSLAMVIFNYDRCVEHFLFNAIQTFYDIDDTEAAELVNRIEIYHPYGQVGHLPWQKGNGSIDYGVKQLNPSELLSLSKQIKTFTEGTDPSSSDISAIQGHVKSCDIIMFLGFAFHDLNMELLKPNYDDGKPAQSESKCFATADGISEHNIKIIERKLIELKGLTEGNTHVRKDLKCAKLFQEYSKSLSLA